MWRLGFVVGTAAAILGVGSSQAMAAVTPGWECIPITAGQAVVSGGTASFPSCGAGTTPVLAPTYVSSGVGGKPTVQFSAVNVQVISGSGSTSGTVNGEGNLVVGYAENTTGKTRTGSNDLVVGSENGWTSYGSLVGGFENQASGRYATTAGAVNTASGPFSLVAGEANKATGTGASATGGEHNVANGGLSSVTGGEFNQASDSFAGVSGGCRNLAGSGSPLSATCSTSGIEAVLGGFDNIASSPQSSVVGGQSNDALAPKSSILGGEGNTTAASCQAVPAAPGSC